MKKYERFLKYPWGIITAVPLMILSFIIIALTVVSIISNAMIANAGGDDGLSEMLIFKIMWVLLFVLSAVFIISLVFYVLKKINEAKIKEKKHHFKKSIFVLLSSYVLIWFVVALVAGNVLDGFKDTINDALGLTGYRTETIDTGDVDREYYKSDYVKKSANGDPIYVTDTNGYKHQSYDDEALHQASVKKADQVQREGTTILWNNNDAGILLAKNSKISVFSHSSVDWVYSGGGSGNARVTYATNLKEAFTNAGLSINETLWGFYSTGAGKDYVRTDRYLMNEVPWNVYTNEVKNSFSTYNDAAVLVLSRRAGEGSVAQGGAFDVTITDADTPSGDYYDLSNEERELLNQIIQLKNNGTFSKIIVLLNTPTGMWMDNIVANKDDIDACIWVGQTGFEGLNEVGRILVGTSYASGHLVDTFLYNTQADPAFINSKASLYSNAATSGLTDNTFQGYYLVYQEGIYVGYRYYETRYEDAVLGRGNATSNAGIKHSTNNWRYKDEVAFPFGYGYSSTTFEYTDFDVQMDEDDNYIASLVVTNTGNKVGKDAIQIYLQRPYTQYDVDNNIEQSAVNLVGYYKTIELAPNQSESISITVDKENFATYDANNKKTYIREKTNGINAYYLTAAHDAHEAINNILSKKGKTPTNTANMMDAEGNSELVKVFDFAEDDFVTFSKSKNTNHIITNQFDDTDWNKYENRTSSITYLSRNDWLNTYPIEPPSLSLNAGMVADLSWDKEVAVISEDVMPKYSQPQIYTLMDLKGAEYDDARWDTLLDQMSLNDQINLLAKAYKGTGTVTSIGKPKDKAGDGPLGIKEKYKSFNAYTMSYPNTNLLAATYNDRLAEEVGVLMGEDMLHTGVSCLYGPGANIHRTTYSGRNYEYYSEDGFLSGIMLKQQVKGIQSKGCYVNVKHIALNDQEDHRYGAGVWANEQSIREIYLEAFKYTSREGCTGFMSAFTRFGTTWSGAHKGLCTEVLRNEWGFKGFVISDCAWRKYMGVVDGLMAGNDCILYESTDLTQYYKANTNPTIAKAMRESTKRILYVTANCNVMNGLSAGTRTYMVNEWWQNTVIGIQIGLGALTGLLVILTILCFIFHKQIDQYLQNRYEKKRMKKLNKKPDNINENNELKLNKFEKFMGIGQIWNANRVIKTILCITVSLALLTGAFFVGTTISSGGSNNQEEEETVYLLPKEYRFEAECAEIVSTISNFGAGIESGRTVESTNYPSADGYVYGLSRTGDASLTFYIHASEACEVNMSLVLGLSPAKKLSTLFTYTLNGKNIEYDTTIEIPAYTSIQYFEWTKIAVTNMTLKKGDNVLVLTKVSSGLNFDYLSLYSPVTLMDSRDYHNGSHQYEDWKVDSIPTLLKNGSLSARCHNCGEKYSETLLPLSKANGYQEQVINSNTDTTFGYSNWTITRGGQNFTFSDYTYPKNANPNGYIFEAESAIFTGSAQIAQDATIGVSGDAYVDHLAGATWTITFNIFANDECEALLYMRLGRRNDRDVVLNSGKVLTLNGTQIEIPDSVVFPIIQSESKYNNFEEFEVTILHLNQGNNSLVLSNTGYAFTNLDYFRFVSASELSWQS